MQQVPQESIFDVCLNAFNLTDNFENRQRLKLDLTAKPTLIIPEDYLKQFECISNPSNDSIVINSEILNSPEFHCWVIEITEHPEKIIKYLQSQGIKFTEMALISSISEQLSVECITMLTQTMNPIPFSYFLQCLGMLKLYRLKPKTQQWAIDLHGFLIENAQKFVVADPFDLDWQCCFHSNQSYFSIIRDNYLQLHFISTHDAIPNILTFDFNHQSSLYNNQKILSLVEFAFEFELPANQMESFIEKQCFLKQVNGYAKEILEQLSLKPEYFEHLNAILNFTAPLDLKSYLVLQEDHNTQFKELEIFFKRPTNFWNSSMIQYDECKQALLYQTLWHQVESSKTVIPNIKEQLQAVIDAPCQGTISFEEWLYYNTKVSSSFISLNRWGLTFNNRHTYANNLFLLGIFHKQPLIYFKFLLEKLNYKLSISDYFNVLACTHLHWLGEQSAAWLNSVWPYIQERGNSFIDMEKHQNYSYYFDEQEEALMILLETKEESTLQLFYIDKTNKTQHKQFFVSNISKLKQLNFNFFFESNFVLEQVNPPIILQCIFNFLEKYKQLDFMKKLLLLIQNEDKLRDYKEYRTLLNHPIVVRTTSQDINVSLDSYLQHHIKRIQFLEPKWLNLIDTVAQTFQAKASIIVNNDQDNYQLVLNQFLSVDNPPSKKIILPTFKEWLFASKDAIKHITKIIDKGYQIDDHYFHHISALSLSVIHHFPFHFIKELVEKHSFKCSVIEFLQIMALLEIYSHDEFYSKWTMDLKTFFLTNRFSIVIANCIPTNTEYFFYNHHQSLVIHDLKNQSYCLIEKHAQQPGLQKDSFYLNYASEDKIIFDTPLQLAVQLQMPCDFLELMISTQHIQESAVITARHMYFELLKFETSTPLYYQQLLGLMVNKFNQLDPNNNTLLHFLVLQDRPDLIEKHFIELKPFINQVNRFQQTALTADLKCSKPTLSLLFAMEPKLIDGHTIINLMINPEYTEIVLGWLSQHPEILKQSLPCGLNVIEELFNSASNLLAILKIMVTSKIDILAEFNPSHLFLLSLNQAFSSDTYKSMMELLKLKNKDLNITHFITSCEKQLLGFARFIFPIEYILCNHRIIFDNPQVLNFIIKENLIASYPVLVEIISDKLPTLSSEHQKTYLKQIFNLAKSQKYWLSEYKDFPMYVTLSLNLELFKACDLVKGGENLLYYVEYYCYQHGDYSFLTELLKSDYKIDINKKNASQEHLIMSICKQDNGLLRLKTFLSIVQDHEVQIQNLDSLLDIAINSHDASFIEWCFERYSLVLDRLIEDDLKQKSSHVIELSRKNPKLFSHFSQHFQIHHWQKLKQLAEQKGFADLKHHLPEALLLAPVMKQEPQMNWQTFKTFLMSATPSQILNLPNIFKNETLPKLLVENNSLELFQLLKDRPILCLKEFNRIKVIATILQDVADACYINEDEELLKKIMASLPKDIQLKNRNISDWSSLKRLLSENAILAFKLLSNEKLAHLLEKNNIFDLYEIILAGDLELVKQFHEYPVVRAVIPTILHQVHLQEFTHFEKVIYACLPKEFTSLRRLYTLAKTTKAHNPANFACHSNSLLALNLFTSSDEQFAIELKKRRHQPSPIWIEANYLPPSLKHLYQCIYPWLHPKHRYLGLFGSAIRHIYNRKAHHSDYDCFVTLTIDLKHLFEKLKELKIGAPILVNSSKPVIRLFINEPDLNVTQIDLSCFALDEELEVHEAIAKELEKHDFTVSGAYTLIDEQSQFQIYGSQKALISLQEKTLSLMEPNRLQEDPLRLLRAVKLQLDDSAYQADEELTSILESGQPQKALEEFLDSELHCKQFITQLNKILINPEQQLQMFELMDKYHFLETWTGFKFADIKDQLASLPKIDSKHIKACQLQFIKYLYILTSLQKDQRQKLESTVIYKVTRGFSPAERMFFDFIDSQLWGKEFNCYIDARDTIELIEHARSKPSHML